MHTRGFVLVYSCIIWYQLRPIGKKRTTVGRPQLVHSPRFIPESVFYTQSVILITIWPVRPREQFPWKTIREKVPYEGRTRRSDRAGKTRTALLEMRTALLETHTAKSMRVNHKNNSFDARFCSLQNESWKWTFWEQILLSRRIVPCRTTSVANSLRKQRKKFNTRRKRRSLQLSQKPTTKQAVKEATFPDKMSRW